MNIECYTGLNDVNTMSACRSALIISWHPRCTIYILPGSVVVESPGPSLSQSPPCYISIPSPSCLSPEFLSATHVFVHNKEKLK